MIYRWDFPLLPPLPKDYSSQRSDRVFSRIGSAIWVSTCSASHAMEDSEGLHDWIDGKMPDSQRNSIFTRIATTSCYAFKLLRASPLITGKPQSLRYPHVGLEHSHDRLSASRTNHTSAPLEHHCARSVTIQDIIQTNTTSCALLDPVTPLCASYHLPCTIVHPSHRLHCLRARSNPELLGFHQHHNRSHPQPARWDR